MPSDGTTKMLLRPKDLPDIAAVRYWENSVPARRSAGRPDDYEGMTHHQVRPDPAQRRSVRSPIYVSDLDRNTSTLTLHFAFQQRYSVNVSKFVSDLDTKG